MAPDDPTEPAEESTFGAMLRVLAAAPGKRRRALLVAGDRVRDKYRIVRELGHGGMGVVYLAHDESLARDVALKVGTVASAEGLERAAREARVLAALSHPNVVVVHEVGSVAGRLFVAMEYVAGGTARAWLAAAPRTPREIVRLYAEAADGLAAAHAAGIVHRDFKPDNLLVGEDGRARVADFGVALAVGASGAPTSTGPSRAAVSAGEPATSDGEPASGSTSADEPASDARLTSADAAIGTRAYMAPEQLTSATVDARADQYALCVALWEALYGERPPGRSATKVPRHVVAALRRGLARDPEERWPSAGELAAALRADPAARRARWWLAGGAVVAVVAAVAITLGVAGGAADPCAIDRASLGDAWSPAREQGLAHAFEVANARAAWPDVQRHLARYATGWIAGSIAACKATAPPEDRAKRSACLDRARVRLGLVGEALAGGGRAAIAHADDQLAILPDLAPCADLTELAAAQPLPVDPARRAGIATVDRDIAAAQLALARREPLSPADAAALALRARALGWPALEALAADTEGLALERHGDPAGAHAAFERGANAALGCSCDAVAGGAMADLARSYARSGNVAEALRWVHLGEAVGRRIGSPVALAVRLARAEGDAVAAGPHPADSLAVRQRVFDLAQRADDLTAAEREAAYAELAEGYRLAGDLDAAEHQLAIGEPRMIAAVGPDHPDLVAFATEAELIALARNHLPEAEAAARRAVAVTTAWEPEASSDVLVALQDLGTVLQREGNGREALATAARALAISTQVDPSSATTGMLEDNVGIALALSGHAADARPHVARAVAVLEPLWGKDSARLIDAYVAVGWVARSEGRMDDSVAAIAHAVALADAGGAGVDRVNPRLELSYTLVAAKRGGDAVATLAQVADDVAANRTEPRYAAEYHLALAGALAASGKLGEARTEAAASRAAWLALGARGEVAGVDAWLAAHAK